MTSISVWIYRFFPSLFFFFFGTLSNGDDLHINSVRQLEFNGAEVDNKASHASTLYATACRHFHHAATILTALTGQSNDENVPLILHFFCLCCVLFICIGINLVLFAFWQL